eukprot:jgi/Picre1/32741/NNA_008086.t1
MLYGCSNRLCTVLFTYLAALCALVGSEAYVHALNLDEFQSGTYRFALCDGWTGCSDVDEYLGFNNKTCTAGVPPESTVYGNTVGPVLRDFKESVHWKSWEVDVLSKDTSGAEVTLMNKYTGSGESRCKNHYLADYSEKKDACIDSEWADRVHLHKDKVKWSLKPVKGSDECFNIINDEKPAGCLRYLSARNDCNDRYLNLAATDDGSGLQQWRIERVGPPLPPSPSPDALVITAASAASSTTGTVSFSPSPDATECTVTETAVGSRSLVVDTVITRLSYPITTTHLTGLEPNTAYVVDVIRIANQAS